MKLILIQTRWASLLAVAALALATQQPGRAETIGINLLGNAQAQIVTGAAGVLAITNWNNITNTSYTSGTIYSSDGSQTLTLTMSGSGTTHGWNNGTADDGGDGSLMRGYCDAGINNPVTNVISGLTASTYTVYLYCQGDAQRPGNGGDWLPNYTVNGVQFCTATLGGSFSGYSQGGVSLSNTNTYPPPLAYGNYIEIDGVRPVDGKITISANSDNHSWRSPLNGIEIVSNTVVQCPSIQAQTPSLTNYAGTTVSLTVVASGTPLNYQWQAGPVGAGVFTNLVDNSTISGATNATLTISNLNLANMGDYIVIITNSACSVTSAIPTTVGVVTMVLSGPQPAVSQVYPGASAHFTVTVSGTEPLSYHWRKNGVYVTDAGDLSGTGTNELVVSNAGAGDVANYDVVVTNAYGAITSSIASLGLATAPEPGSYAQALFAKGPAAYWRLNETTGTNAFDYAGGYTATYGNSTAMSVAGPSTPDWPGFESSNYAIQETTGAEDSAVATPAGEALNLNTNTVTFVAWLNPISPPTANAGIVFSRGSGSAVAGLNFSGNGNLGYNWNNDGGTWSWDSGLTVPSGQWSFVALAITPTNATMYLYNANGQASSTFVHSHAVTPFSGPVFLGDDPAFGDGSRVFYGDVDEVAVFNRTLSNSEIVQLYQVASATFVGPSISMQPQSQAVLPGSTVQFSVNAAGTTPLTYQWLKNSLPLSNGTGVSGATTPALTLSGVSSGSSGDYSVVVTNVVGAITSSVASLVVLTETNYDTGMASLSPLGYWRLNETTGTTAADSSGNGLNGAYQAAVTLGVPGAPNPPFAGFGASDLAVSLNGQDGSWVSLPALNLNSDTASFTAWIKPTGTQAGSAGLIFCRDGVGTTSGFSYNPAGTQLGYTWNDDGSTYGWNSGLTPPADVWSFVVLVVTPTNAIIYLDNTNGTSAATFTHLHISSSFGGETRIGNDAFSAARTFNGSIEQAAVFNYPLNFAQVQQLYVNGLIGNAAPPAVNLNWQRSGAALTLTWTQGTLLQATNLLGPWTTNASPSPVTVTPNGPQTYYRVRVQ